MTKKAKQVAAVVGAVVVGVVAIVVINGWTSWSG